MDSLAATLVAGMLVSAQASPTPSAVRLRSEHQVIDASSQSAWTVVQAHLKALDLHVDKLDRANQAVLTKWIPVPNKKVPWLPEPEVVEPGQSVRIRFQVFVSPFVQPANVFVGSQAELVSHNRRLMLYNNARYNRALMSQLDGAFTKASLQRYVPDDADPCRPGAKPSAPRPVGMTRIPKADEPRKIPLSVLEIPYPAPDREAQNAGPITLELSILKAGAVDSIRSVGPPVGAQLLAAASGAASLLLYSPVKLDGCPAPFTMTYTVNFKMQ